MQMLRIDKESNFIFRKSDYNCFCLIKITSSYFFCKSLHFLSYVICFWIIWIMYLLMCISL